jgi:hypothetical protein
VREAERLTQDSDVSGQVVWRRVIAKLRANNISHAVAIGFQEGLLP